MFSVAILKITLTNSVMCMMLGETKWGGRGLKIDDINGVFSLCRSMWHVPASYSKVEVPVVKKRINIKYKCYKVG